jgi:DNA-directed RNA polymerase subunit RPC12/RpoP
MDMGVDDVPADAPEVVVSMVWKGQVLGFAFLAEAVLRFGEVSDTAPEYRMLQACKYTCTHCSYVLGPFTVGEQEHKMKGVPCPSCQSKGPYVLNTEETVYNNYQKLTLQESPGSVTTLVPAARACPARADRPVPTRQHSATHGQHGPQINHGRASPRSMTLNSDSSHGQSSMKSVTVPNSTYGRPLTVSSRKVVPPTSPNVNSVEPLQDQPPSSPPHSSVLPNS